MRYSPAIAMLVGLTALAHADVIPIFSTGNGHTNDGYVDPNWTYTNSSSTTAHAFVANNPCVDIWVSCTGAEPAWMADSALSAWLVDNTTGPQSGGDPLSFQTSFDLTGLIPSTAKIALEWGVDDGADLLLNGNTVAVLADECCMGLNWKSLHPLTISSGFLPGINTLQVNLTANNNFYEGVRVQIDSATAVPEPSLVVLLAMALAILAGVRRTDTAPGR